MVVADRGWGRRIVIRLYKMRQALREAYWLRVNKIALLSNYQLHEPKE